MSVRSFAQSSPAPCIPLNINGSFETNDDGGYACTWGTNSFATQKIAPFNAGCVPGGWFAANGTPNLFKQVFGDFPATPFAGSVFAGIGCAASPCFNEVLALNVTLDPNYNYELSFAYRATASTIGVPGINPFTGNVVVTSGLVNHPSAAGLEPCISTGGTNIFSAAGNTTAWTSVTVPFTPSAGQNQIVFMPVATTGTNTAYWLIDNVVLRRCTPCKASFTTVYCSNPGNCIYTFYNTSTASSGASITGYEWTVTALNDPEQPVYTFTDRHLVFAPSCNGLYKVCLKIKDSKGCEKEYCEVINVTCSTCKCVAGPNPCEALPNDDTVRTAGGRDGLKTAAFISVEPKPAYKLYPNPAKNYFQLEYTSDKNLPAKLSVVNTAGREVISQHLTATPGAAQRVQVSKLQKGLYIVKVIQGGSVVFTDKVLIAD